MSRKRITPEKMKSVKASFKLTNEAMNHEVSDLIESSVTGNLGLADTLSKTVCKTVADTIDSFDQFLNEVADTMAELDSELAEKITYEVDQTYFSRQERNKKIQRDMENIYYNRLD